MKLFPENQSLFATTCGSLALLSIVASGFNLSPISLPSPLQALNSNFVSYYLVLHLCTAALLFTFARMFARFYCVLLIGVLLGLSSFYALELSPFYFSGHRDTENVLPSEENISALYADLEDSPSSAQNLLGLIASKKPSIVALSGVNASVAKILENEKTLKIISVVARHDGFGTALLSVLPAAGPVKTSVSDGFDSLPPIIQAEFTTSQGPLLVTVMKLAFPQSKDEDRSNALLLRRVFVGLRHDDRNFMVLGNFNTAPGSLYYSRIIWTTSAHDVMEGFGLHPTCCSNFPLTQLPLSHIFVRGEISVDNAAVLPSIGGNTYPLISELHLKS